MKKMYRVEEHRYEDTSRGAGNLWVSAEGYYNTVEEAKANAKSERNYVSDGSWRVVERVMDEATFTVEDTVVYTFNYWKEVGRKEHAREAIANLEEKIAAVEASKVRARTAAGVERKDKEIAEMRRVKGLYEKVLAE